MDITGYLVYTKRRLDLEPNEKKHVILAPTCELDAVISTLAYAFLVHNVTRDRIVIPVFDHLNHFCSTWLRHEFWIDLKLLTIRPQINLKKWCERGDTIITVVNCLPAPDIHDYVKSTITNDGKGLCVSQVGDNFIDCGFCEPTLLKLIYTSILFLTKNLTDATELDKMVVHRIKDDFLSSEDIKEIAHSVQKFYFMFCNYS